MDGLDWMDPEAEALLPEEWRERVEAALGGPDVLDGVLRPGKLALALHSCGPHGAAFAQHVARCVAGGTRCFGRAVAAGPVLFVDLGGDYPSEEGLAAMARRAGKRGRLAHPLLLADLGGMEMDLTRPADRATLWQNVALVRPSLLVLQGITRAFWTRTTTTGWDREGMARDLLTVAALAERAGCAVLATDDMEPVTVPKHDRDGHRAALPDACDAVMEIVGDDLRRMEAVGDGFAFPFAIGRWRTGRTFGGVPRRAAVLRELPAAALAA